MTILHTETLKHWGGQQNRVLSEAIGLGKRGHRVIIVCHKGSLLAQKAKAAGVTVYEVNMVKQAHLMTIPRLVSIIKKEGVDIVSTHSSVDSWAGGIAAKLTGRRLVRFRHNLYRIGRDPLTRFIYAIPDGFIVTSPAVKDVLYECGVRNRKMMVLPSSVNKEIFSPEVDDLRKGLNIPPGTLVIGNTSGFMLVKGQKYLLQAFNIICEKSPCVLLLAGNLVEPFKSRYLSHVREDLREKVILLGHRDDIPRVLKTIDVFVFPSVLDSTPTSLLEAMTMEMPVAVSDIPTFKYFIKDGINGLYFNKKDPEDLAKKVLSLIRSKDLSVQLAKNARSTALELFSVDKMLDLTEAYYAQILKAS